MIGRRKDVGVHGRTRMATNNGSLHRNCDLIGKGEGFRVTHIEPVLGKMTVEFGFVGIARAEERAVGPTAQGYGGQAMEAARIDYRNVPPWSKWDVEHIVVGLEPRLAYERGCETIYYEAAFEHLMFSVVTAQRRRGSRTRGPSPPRCSAGPLSHRVP